MKTKITLKTNGVFVEGMIAELSLEDTLIVMSALKRYYMNEEVHAEDRQEAKILHDLMLNEAKRGCEDE